ncbi:MAG: hypothetical protein K0U37_05400 [Gammaproteobacteria bacterium]|nr:hypothetical protein [Gammaproteobacteria bacterium]
MNKVFAALLGFLVYPVITVLTAALNLIGFLSLAVATLLLAPFALNAIESLIRGFCEQIPALAERLPRRPSMAKTWGDNLKLRLQFLGLSVGLLAIGITSELLSVLHAPWDGLITGAKNGFSGLSTLITERLFNPFSLKKLGQYWGNEFILESAVPGSTAESIIIRLRRTNNNTQTEATGIAMQLNEIRALRETTPETPQMRASWDRGSTNLEQATCPLLYDIPDTNSAVIFEKQYKIAGINGAPDQWLPIENTSQIFSEIELTNWLNRNGIHPMHRDSIRVPTPHVDGNHTYPTRWRIIPLNEDNQTLIEKLEQYKADNNPSPTNATSSTSPTASAGGFFNQPSSGQTQTSPATNLANNL